jgi:hypothetical protein
MKRLITILSVLAFATSAMAASVNYQENWDADGAWDKATVGQNQGDWTQTAGSDSMFKSDPTIPSEFTGGNLMMQSALGDKGIYNDLNDGDNVSDPLAAGEFVAATASENVVLSSAYRQFSKWGGASVNMYLTLSGADHSVALRVPGGTTDEGDENYDVSIDGGAWVDTGMIVRRSGAAGWDGIYIEVSPGAITVGVDPLSGDSNPARSYEAATGDFTGWEFDTITIENVGADNSRTGYLAAVTLTGEIVPEPAALLLLSVGLPFLARRRRR